MDDAEHNPLVDAWPAYVVSFVIYVVAGLLFRSTVLNWIVGPLWLLATLHLVPGLWRRLVGGSTPA